MISMLREWNLIIFQNDYLKEPIHHTDEKTLLINYENSNLYINKKLNQQSF